MPTNPQPLQTKTVKGFRGIDQFTSYVRVAMDWATDCLNVIVSAMGGLEKLRVPAIISGLMAATPQSFFQFQQSKGAIREVLAVAGTKVYHLDGDALAPVQLDDDPLNAGDWSMVTSNNIAFGANGKRMQKYDGQWTKWGIPKPDAAPVHGVTYELAGIFRTGGIVTFALVGPTTKTNPINVIANDNILVAGVSDLSFNGVYQQTTAGGFGATFQYANAGPDVPTIMNSGTVTFYRYLGVNPITHTRRIAGVASVFVGDVVASQAHVGEVIIVEAVVDVTFNTTARITAIDMLGWISYAQSDQVDSPDTVVVAGTVSVSMTGATKVMYRYAFKDSVTGHRGPSSDPSVDGPVYVDTNHSVFNITAPSVPPAGYTVDTIVWERTYDGGGDFYKLTETTLNHNWLYDNWDSSELNKLEGANFINYPPPTGKLLLKFQNRIVVGGLTNDPQLLAYSGFEQILVGRPEESFPPNNLIRLNIGADTVGGMGATPDGIVIWSITNEMYYVAGTLEDIVNDAPVAFSASLRQLPWQEGCKSFQSIQSTNKGVVWQGADGNFKIWTGSGEPRVMTAGIYSIIKRQTAGTLTKSAFFNYAERDWYVALICLDGAVTPNWIIFLDIDDNANSNIGTFIANIEANAVGVIEMSDGTRVLGIAKDKAIYSIHAVSDCINGLVSGAAPPNTANQLPAFWQSGWYGNDNPMVMKMFRKGLLVTDGVATNRFGLEARIEGDTGHTAKAPLHANIPLQPDGRHSINWKGRRMQVAIQFPDADVSCTVLELTETYVPLAVR